MTKQALVPNFCSLYFFFLNWNRSRISCCSWISTQILHDVETSGASDEHPLALLAEQTKKLLKKDAIIFMPILSQRHPQAPAVSASILHKLYGIKLVRLNLLYVNFYLCSSILYCSWKAYVNILIFRNRSLKELSILRRMLYLYFLLLIVLSSM